MNQTTFRVLCFTLIAVSTTSAFNLGASHAQVYRDPHLVLEGYFGYTVALQQRTTGEYRLLVGAPRAKSLLLSHEDIVEPGVLYTCSVTSPYEPCTAVELDPEGDGEFDIFGYVPVNASDKNVGMRDHAWIGGALDVQDRPGGDIVTCGPRWKNRRWGMNSITKEHEDEDWNMNGICYHITESTSTTLLPLVDPNKQMYFRTRNETADPFVFNYKYAGAGLSVHFVQKKSEFLISAPGTVKWKGNIIRYKSSTSKPDIQDNIKHRTGGSQLYDNFGYSLVTGKFNTASASLIAAVGTPKSGDKNSMELTGRVFLLDFQKGLQNDDGDVYKIVAKVNGTQMGEYFGASLCVIDANSDGFDDLVVGAPMYSKFSFSNMDEGRVYVFLNRKDGLFFRNIPDYILEGLEIPGARFGTSVTNIGDINADGHDDIAVGAPYEQHVNGSGSIYIYHGGNGVNKTFSQRITADDLQYLQPVNGFGISISRGFDVDDNTVRDIAVGAYESSHAILIKSYPVIKFVSRIKIDFHKLDTTATNFTVKACLKYIGRNNLQLVDAVVRMTADPSYRRAQFVVNDERLYVTTYNITLSRDIETCALLLVKIANMADLFYTKPIEIHMQYWVNRGRYKSERFNKLCPAVDPNDQNSTRLDVSYSVGCDGKVCRPDLSVKATFSESPLVVGAKTLVLGVEVQNVGELAYQAMANVTLPSITPLVRLPSYCAKYTNESGEDFVVKCLLRDYFVADTTLVLELELETSYLPEHLTHLDFSMNVFSDGDEQTALNNMLSTQLPLKRVADISIRGLVNQSFSRVNLDEHLIFSHTYDVQNFGPSPLSALIIDFDIPVTLLTAEGRISLVNVTHPSLSDSSKNISCSTSGSFVDVVNSTAHKPMRVKQSTSLFTSVALDGQQPTLFVNCTAPGAECMKVRCEAGPFTYSSSSVIVTFQMRADMKKLGELLDGVESVVFSSVGAVSFSDAFDVVQEPNDKSDTASVHSEFLGNILPASVPLWIIAVAVAAGLVVLIIIISICTRCGFFTRKKKEDLNTLKEQDPGPKPQEEEELLGE